MSQFIEPPPLNDPIVSDTTGKIKSTPWVLWLNNLADAISSGILDNMNAVQSTVPSDSMTTKQDIIADVAMYNYETMTMTTTNTTSEDILTLYWMGV